MHGSQYFIFFFVAHFELLVLGGHIYLLVVGVEKKRTVTFDDSCVSFGSFVRCA